MTQPDHDKPQPDKFRSLARELEYDEDEGAFEEKVRKVAHAETGHGAGVVRNLFWPSTPNPNPAVLTRAGRVVHWIGTTIAAALAALVTMVLLTTRDPLWSDVILAGLWAIVIYFAGRSVRYILSAE